MSLSLGSILGIVGTVAGTAIAGPAGGAVGGALGGLAGNALDDGDSPSEPPAPPQQPKPKEPEYQSESSNNQGQVLPSSPAFTNPNVSPEVFQNQNQIQGGGGQTLNYNQLRILTGM